MTPRANKPFLTEKEAARSLGISVEEFRGLVRRYIAHFDVRAGSERDKAFKASDIVILRHLVASSAPAPGEQTVTG